MSFLKEKYNKIYRTEEGSDRRKEEKLKGLENSLSILIDDVKNNPKFPKEAEEMLYDFSGEPGYNNLALIKNLRDTYILTKGGVKKVWELRMDGDMLKKLTIGTIDSRKLTSDETDPKFFDTVCDNIQRITDKYKMKVDRKKYLTRI